MSFREELIEAMAKAVWGFTPDEPDGWRIAMMTTALDAALAFRRSEVCPTCGGQDCKRLFAAPETTAQWTPNPDCIDGRVPVEYPRLAVVGEQVGQIGAMDGWGQNSLVLSLKGSGLVLRNARPVFSLHQEEAER